MKVLKIAFVGLSLMSIASPVLAQNDFYDLIGARAAGGETQLRARGWWQGRAQEGSTQTITYWGRNDQCIQVITRDGRYRAITPVGSNFCASYGRNDPSSDASHTSASAAVAGVAIIGLAAAIAAHNSHHRDADADHDREYERGYQAGLSSTDYDARHETEGYHEGYLAGEDESRNRRHSGSQWVRGASEAARDACSRAADDYQNRPYGSSVPISTRDLGRNEYELTMGTGTYRSRCRVTASGDVQEMSPY